MPHGQPHIPQTGLIGSEAALQQGLAGAISGLEQGVGLGRQDLQPFASGGADAFALQQALSGAGGPQAQQQAFANFQASPGQDFLREQGEQTLLRNASAIGGLGGGRVRSELQRQGIGFAAQDFGNQFNRLSGLSNIGAGAAGQQANLAGQGGNAAANFAFGTGQSLAGGRTRAGEQIASSIGSTTSALSNLINQGGAGLADLLSGASGNLANILQNAGTTQGASQQQLATLLANILGGQPSVAGIPGTQQTPGIIGGVGQLASGIGTGLAAF